MGVGRPRPYPNHPTRNPDVPGPEPLRNPSRRQPIVGLPIRLEGQPENNLVEHRRKSLHFRAA